MEPARFLRNRVRVRRKRSDNSGGYADLERALRELGMHLFLQFTADLVPLVLQRIAASRKRPADHDGLPPASHLARRPSRPRKNEFVGDFEDVGRGGEGD